MDLKGIVKEITIESITAAVVTGVAFGVGCLSGMIVKGPVLLTGGIYAIDAIANIALTHLAKFLAKKFNWNLSTYHFSKALIGVALSTAVAVSCLALGIFGPVGFGVAIGLGLFFAAIPFGRGLYLKFSGKDMPYVEAVANKKKALDNDETLQMEAVPVKV